MKVTAPAWIDDHYVGLREVLDLVGENDWVWCLEHFHGVSRPGSSINVLDLESRLSEGEVVEFDWHQLLRFADRVQQMVDGRLVAHSSRDRAEPVLVVEAVDSTEWTVEAGDHEGARAATGRVASLGRRP